MRQRELHDNKDLISSYLNEPAVQAVVLKPEEKSVQMPGVTLQACSKQLSLLTQFQQVVDYWIKAEQMIERNSACKDWFGQFHATEVGNLQMSSNFEHLINYTLNGIKNLNV